MGSFPVWIGSTSSSKKCCDESVKAPFLRDRLIHCNDMNAKKYTILNIPRSRSWTITKNDLCSLENIACGLRDKQALEFARPMNVVYYYNIICTLKRSSIARTPILCQTWSDIDIILYTTTEPYRYSTTHVYKASVNNIIYN